MRVFINGFGRIGRAALAIMIKDPEIEIVGINDIYDFESMAQLLAHDSIYGAFDTPVLLEKNHLLLDTLRIPLFREKEAHKLHLKGVDILLQCTGVHLDRITNIPYLDAGAKKILISAPAASDIPTMVMDTHNKALPDDRIFSNSSCSANAIVPLLDALDSVFKIQAASLSMYHAYTAYQKLLDVKHYSKDIRRARSATQNIQPLMSSAASETEKFFPHLHQKVTAKSIRVPLSAVTLYDITLKVQKTTSLEQIQTQLKKQVSRYPKLLALAHKDAVSTDFIASPFGAIIDLSLTQIIGEDFIKIGAWQDNEYGYATQLVRMAKSLS